MVEQIFKGEPSLCQDLFHNVFRLVQRQNKKGTNSSFTIDDVTDSQLCTKKHSCLAVTIRDRP